MNRTSQGGRTPPAFRETLGKDALASVVVFLVALPLCMGVAIASGMSPMAGLITGVVGGLVVGPIAGSPLQVSGPAAGLTVLVWQLVQQHGIAMLGVIVLLAGLMQLAAGLLKLGQWFRAVSPAVIHGMLAGIGLLILGSQFHVMLDGKPVGSGLANFTGIPRSLAAALSSSGPPVRALALGVFTVTLIVLWGRFAPGKLRLLPGPLVAVLVSVIAAAALGLKVKYIPDLLANPEDVNRFWAAIQLPTLDVLRRALDRDVLIAAVSVAFIASAETLLSASAVDQLHKGPRTKYDKELVAQGVGNSVCGLLGALPMTGVIVRSTANVEAGARTRTSTILHGAWLLLFAAALPFVLRVIPVASLAGVLVFTGYKLAYPKAVPGLLKYGRSEVAIYLVTIVMIVSTNLLEGVLVGLGLSVLKLLYVFSHLEVRLEDEAEANRVHVHLKGAATLIRLPKLATALEDVRPGTEVHVHFEHLDYIDHACLDLLSSWERQHEVTGGTLVIEWEELSSRYYQRRPGAQKGAGAAESP